MTYQLTDEQRKEIKNLGSTYWQDLKFRLKDNQVIRYVDGWNGEQDRCVFAESEDAAAIICAIWNCPEYYNRSKVSATSIVQAEIRKAYVDAPDFAKANLAKYL